MNTQNEIKKTTFNPESLFLVKAKSDQSDGTHICTLYSNKRELTADGARVFGSEARLAVAKEDQYTFEYALQLFTLQEVAELLTDDSMSVFYDIRIVEQTLPIPLDTYLPFGAVAYDYATSGFITNESKKYTIYYEIEPESTPF
jgi:hypothetical protein